MTRFTCKRRHTKAGEGSGTDSKPTRKIGCSIHSIVMIFILFIFLTISLFWNEIYVFLKNCWFCGKSSKKKSSRINSTIHGITGTSKETKCYLDIFVSNLLIRELFLDYSIGKLVSRKCVWVESLPPGALYCKKWSIFSGCLWFEFWTERYNFWICCTEMLNLNLYLITFLIFAPLRRKFPSLRDEFRSVRNIYKSKTRLKIKNQIQ